MLKDSIMVLDEASSRLKYMKLIPALIWAFKDTEAYIDYQGQKSMAFLFVDQVMINIKKCSTMKMIYLSTITKDYKSAIEEYFGNIELVQKI